MADDEDRPPRIPPLAREDADERQGRLLDAFPPVKGLEGRKPDKFLATVARHPAIVEPWNKFAVAILRDGTLTPRQRELVILRLACRRRNAYVWGGHVGIAQGAEMTEDEIYRVADFPYGGEWTALEQALLAAADEIYDFGGITDATWTALASELDEEALLEIPLVAGQYMLVMLVIETIRISPEPDVPPLPEGLPGPLGRR